ASHRENGHPQLVEAHLPVFPEIGKPLREVSQCQGLYSIDLFGFDAQFDHIAPAVSRDDHLPVGAHAHVAKHFIDVPRPDITHAADDHLVGAGADLLDAAGKETTGARIVIETGDVARSIPNERHDVARESRVHELAVPVVVGAIDLEQKVKI